MSLLEEFLSHKEEQEIVEAIRIAEKKTSGEIRVHIESNCDNDSFEHAIEVFHYLKMDNTKLQNGVLIYIAISKKEFVIYGDKGINDIVGLTFWNSTKDKIVHQFKSGNFKQGLIDGIVEIGKVLSEHFPWNHNDFNELDNTISKG
ncbi:TPM domain-containing protein [Winogradskyella poriferorum]|uniref:TPM domain-containing protein n=1 Tax=Winogradskyella poriferorum TaxID=307627 RepID=UPI003D65D178